MKKEIVTFGEIMLRLSKPGAQRTCQGHSFDASYGGSEANVAVSLATMGDSVTYVTRVPDTDLGKAALMQLREMGLDLRFVTRGGKRLGTYYFEPSAAMRGSRIVYDRDNSSFNTMDPTELNWHEILANARLFHCSGITCATSAESRDATFAAHAAAQEMGIEMTCDINYRKNLWRYPGADAQSTLRALVAPADVVFGDQDEWCVVSGIKPIPFNAVDSSFRFDTAAYEQYFAELHRLFPHCRRMLMAHRNQMSFNHHVLAGVLWADGKLYYSRTYDVNPIVDQMGVGDAWIAAFIHARLQWPDDDARCLDFSVSAAALKNTIAGDANLVSEEEVLDNMTNSSGRIKR